MNIQCENFDEHKYMMLSNLENRLSAILRLLETEDINRKRVLDVGCGTGMVSSSLLSRYNCEVYGVDIHKRALKLAANRGLFTSCVNIEKGNLPFTSSVFDVVIFSEVIEHLVNYHHVLDEIHRVMVPRGVLILSTPNLCSAQNIMKVIVGEDVIPIYNRGCDDVHIRLFSFKSINTLLEQHGYKVDKVKFVNYPAKSILGLLRNLLCLVLPRFGDFMVVKAYKIS